MAHQKHPASQPTHSATAPKGPVDPNVKVTFVFRDVLQQPIEGLSVQFKAGTDAEPEPQWVTGPDTDSDTASATPDGASAPKAASAPSDAPAPAASSPPMLANSMVATTDKDGFAITIQNAMRNQPIGVYVKNRRGEYAWKATVTPKKDISAFTIVSPEYHLEATTKLTPKEEFEQNLDLPAVKEGEVMTIERLVNEFGPYIGWSQKVTEQGKVKKDTPTRHEEISVDEKTKKKKKIVTIEHHYKVVDNGKPRTVVLNVLGSRLNYPSPSTFSDEQYKTMATQLDVEVAAIKAIVMQESQGHPFMENGLPTILYERRHFYRFATEKQAALSKETISKVTPKKGEKNKKPHVENPYPDFPDLCFPTGDDYGLGGLHQYEKLARAANLDFEIALKSCSWGGFQILGEYYEKCGCKTVFEFVNKFISGTSGQGEIFVSFMTNVKPAAVKGLKDHNWEAVADSYNGKGWRTKNPTYAKNLGDFYVGFK